MAKKKSNSSEFPEFIHVTREPDDDTPWLQVHETGVDSIEDHGTRVATYKRVSVGTVDISKKIVGIQKDGE